MTKPLDTGKRTCIVRNLKLEAGPNLLDRGARAHLVHAMTPLGGAPLGIGLPTTHTQAACRCSDERIAADRADDYASHSVNKQEK